MSFFSCKVERDILMKNTWELWDCVTVYVHDLEFLVRDPARFTKELEDTYTYKSKVTG